MKYKKNRHKNGFTLIEILISLSLFFILIISSLEFFITVKGHFFELRKDQELSISAHAAMDKMMIDLREGGRGLVIPQKLGVVSSIETNGNTLTARIKDKNLALKNDIVSGSTRIPLHSTTGIKKGQELSILDRQKGETALVLSVNKESVVLTSPLNFSYAKLNTEFISLKKISFYLDQKNRILRRKVNSSSAQPLLEEVQALEFSYDVASNLINVILRTTEERTYEISVFPKNLELAAQEETE